MKNSLYTASSSTPTSRKDHVVITSFPFLLLEVEVEEVALDTHFRVMEVAKNDPKTEKCILR